MNMNHPYTPPGRGITVRQEAATYKTEPELIEAIRTFAAAETKKYGVKISQATLLRDLITRDDAAIRAKRAEFRRLYKANKEKTHHEQEAETIQPADLY